MIVVECGATGDPTRAWWRVQHGSWRKNVVNSYNPNKTSWIQFFIPYMPGSVIAFRSIGSCSSSALCAGLMITGSNAINRQDCLVESSAFLKSTSVGNAIVLVLRRCLWCLCYVGIPRCRYPLIWFFLWGWEVHWAGGPPGGWSGPYLVNQNLGFYQLCMCVGS